LRTWSSIQTHHQSFFTINYYACLLAP
jgi:hypothetical protein